jgi:hypothetical protein
MKEWQDGDDSALEEKGAREAYADMLKHLNEKLEDNRAMLEDEDEFSSDWDYLQGAIETLEVLISKFGEDASV